MISNVTGNLQAITKRRLIALSHYKFREKLCIDRDINASINIYKNEILTR